MQIADAKKLMSQLKVVKILEFKHKISKSAKKLLQQAEKNEPLVTRNLQLIGKLNNAQLIGLQDRFKTTESLIRKLKTESVKRNISVDEVAESISDVLRFTMIFGVDEYGHAYQKVLSDLGEQGYQIDKIWNAWLMDGKPSDTGYRGINVTIISSQNQKFELQFHTEMSFQVKTETHHLYEERRDSKTSRERAKDINKIMRKEALKIIKPKGI